MKKIFLLGISIILVMLSSVFASATWMGFNYRYDWKQCGPEVTDLYKAAEMKCRVIPSGEKIVGAGMSIQEQLDKKRETRSIAESKSNVFSKNIYRNSVAKSTTMPKTVSSEFFGETAEITRFKGEVRGSVTFGFGREIPIAKSEKITKCSPSEEHELITFDRIQERVLRSGKFVEITARNIRLRGCEE